MDGGVDAVRILPLARSLGLSRASFYWFFKDRDDLLHALLDRWRSTNTGSLVQQCEAYADTLAEAVLNVIDCWFRPAMFDARLEFAVRSWALQAPSLQAEVWAADEVRTEAIRALLARFGMPFQTADVRARAIYLTQIGYIAMRVVEEMPVRMRRIPDYVVLYTGVAPTEREMNRFFARIGFDAAQLDGAAAGVKLAS